MKAEIFKEIRNSQMQLNEIYFWTATINKWEPLLTSEAYKKVIIASLTYLTSISKIDVFCFVIMPTHIHLIWRMLDHNGKETPQASFLKYTSHQFLKMLFEEDQNKLSVYRVQAVNKKHEFWQRDPLAIRLYTAKVAYQKMNYIHRNPIAGHWRLVTDPCDYLYSSARFYEWGAEGYGKNDLNFPFLKDLRREFDGA